MRITREKLLKFAQTYVSQQLFAKARPVCIYLTGSVLFEDPLIAGTADIDLIHVHDGEPPVKREVIRIADEVHLDIAHVSQEAFRYPRTLRTDPWLGGFMCYNPRPLHDTQHWFEFTQSSLCAQFDLPGYTIERARPLAEAARQGWMTLQSSLTTAGPQQSMVYLKTLERAANAIACLSGPPLTERRFLLHFPERARQVRRPGLAAGLVDLLTGTEELSAGSLPAFMPGWAQALQAVQTAPGCPIALSAPRFLYYTRAAETLWPQEPTAALWIIVRTWTAAVCCLGSDSPSGQAWQTAMQTLGLAPEQIENRLDVLDAYLDSIEETLDIWAQENGL
ncbi:MAG: hypothetical protein IT308_04590 [Anaerolineaceae bacterium]|nr:hypothetical protein [Anaerolineaceae bacterium]